MSERTDQDRADQIRARVTLYQKPWPIAWSMDEAADEVEWLLDQRRDLLARVEAAERAGAVKALDEMISLRRGPHLGVEHVPVPWIEERRDAIENGAPL